MIQKDRCRYGLYVVNIYSCECSPPGSFAKHYMWILDRLVQISVMGLSSLGLLIGSLRRPHSWSRFLLRRTEVVVRLGSSSALVADVAVVLL